MSRCWRFSVPCFYRNVDIQTYKVVPQSSYLFWNLLMILGNIRYLLKWLGIFDFQIFSQGSGMAVMWCDVCRCATGAADLLLHSYGDSEIISVFPFLCQYLLRRITIHTSPVVSGRVLANCMHGHYGTSAAPGAPRRLLLLPRRTKLKIND